MWIYFGEKEFWNLCILLHSRCFPWTSWNPFIDIRDLSQLWFFSLLLFLLFFFYPFHLLCISLFLSCNGVTDKQTTRYLLYRNIYGKLSVFCHLFNGTISLKRFFKKFIWKVELGRRRRREKSIFQTLVYTPNVCSGPSQVFVWMSRA